MRDQVHPPKQDQIRKAPVSIRGASDVGRGPFLHWAVLGLCLLVCLPSACDTDRSPHDNDGMGLCDGLLIDNDGIPEGYPFGLVADPAREEMAQQALSTMLQTYGVAPQTFKGDLDPITYTLTWHPDLDLTVAQGKIGTDEMTAIMDDFLSQWSDLLLSSDIVLAPEYPRPFDTGSEWNYLYTMDYCGFPIANTRDIGMSLFEGWGLKKRGFLRSRLGKDGVLSRLSDYLVPLTIQIPTNPVLTPEEAQEALVGLEFSYECWDEITVVIHDHHTELPGPPEVLLLETKERINFHLAYPVPVSDNNGDFVFWVDAMTGQLLARHQFFIC
jgi:hypothetical protein